MLNLAMHLPQLADISDRYDGVLSDVWGVVHNAIVPHPAAVKALVAFRQLGKPVVLISNTPRVGRVIQEMLDRMGVTRDAYDAVITSGDATRELIKPYSGGTIHHSGPSIDDPIFEGLNVKKGDAKDAAAVIVTALASPDHTTDDYQEHLREWRSLDLPMICANPDKVVEVGDKIVYCPGALADIYAEMGGEVIVAGKPHQAIYKASMAAMNEAAGRPINPSRVLAIGDSVRTDATGAAGAGMDFLFITGSIHAAEIKNTKGNPDDIIVDLVKPSGANLIGFQERLT